MKSILNRVKGQILIIFDEIEQISPLTAASTHWRTEQDTVLFWQIIRSFCQTESLGKVVICIVGTSPFLIETPKINGLDNPVYLFAQKRFIPNLSWYDVDLMIGRLGFFMGLNFPPQVMSKIFNMYGGHPFFTRQVCSKIHQLAKSQRPQDVSINLLRLAEEAFASDLKGYLQDIISNLKSQYHEEYDLLAEFVRGNPSELSEIANEAPDLVDHLIGYGLITKRGDDYDVTLNAITDVVGGMDSKLLSQTDRWAEVNRRRNHIEQVIRAHLNIWSRSLTADEWSSLFKSALTEKRRESIDGNLPSKIFAKGNSPLYISDLLGFIKLPAVLPYLGENRRLLVENIDIVNRLRKDAHANDFTDSDFELVQNALDILESEFSEL